MTTSKPTILSSSDSNLEATSSCLPSSESECVVNKHEFAEEEYNQLFSEDIYDKLTEEEILYVDKRVPFQEVMEAEKKLRGERKYSMDVINLFSIPIDKHYTIDQAADVLLKSLNKDELKDERLIKRELCFFLLREVFMGNFSIAIIKRSAGVEIVDAVLLEYEYKKFLNFVKGTLENCAFNTIIVTYFDDKCGYKDELQKLQQLGDYLKYGRVVPFSERAFLFSVANYEKNIFVPNKQFQHDIESSNIFKSSETHGRIIIIKQENVTIPFLADQLNNIIGLPFDYEFSNFAGLFEDGDGFFEKNTDALFLLLLRTHNVISNNDTNLQIFNIFNNKSIQNTACSKMNDVYVQFIFNSYVESKSIDNNVDALKEKFLELNKVTITKKNFNKKKLYKELSEFKQCAMFIINNHFEDLSFQDKPMFDFLNSWNLNKNPHKRYQALKALHYEIDDKKNFYDKMVTAVKRKAKKYGFTPV